MRWHTCQTAQLLNVMAGEGGFSRSGKDWLWGEPYARPGTLGLFLGFFSLLPSLATLDLSLR